MMHRETEGMRGEIRQKRAAVEDSLPSKVGTGVPNFGAPKRFQSADRKHSFESPQPAAKER